MHIYNFSKVGLEKKNSDFSCFIEMLNINECLSGRDKARVLFVAQAENPDGSLLDWIKVLEDHSYKVIKCIGLQGFLSHQMEMSTFDIILIEENLLHPMNGSQLCPQSLCGTNTPVIKISYKNIIDCQYHLLKSNIVMPILELMGKYFHDGINKLKRPKEEVKHAELPAEENKKKLNRGKAGEHRQRMAWIGDEEQIFVEVVKELDKNGKATGMKVWELMKNKGFKDISLKQINSHLQKYRDKLKKAHSVDSNSQMLGHKDQVDASSEHDTSRHGIQEHSSNTDAPTNTINGNLNTTSQEHQLFTESLDNNIQGNPNVIQDSNMYDGEGNMSLEELGMGTQSLQMPFEATPESYSTGGCQNNLSMTQGGEPSTLLVCDFQGQAFDKDVPDDHPPRELRRLDSPVNSYFREFEFGYPWNGGYTTSLGENMSVEQPCMGFEEQQQVPDYMNPNS